MVKALIVDDSRSARQLIRRALEAHPAIDDIGEASNPIEARDMIVQDEPDVITLDVEMPGMNGLQFLDKIMRLHPLPVVMVSSLTPRGANIAIKSLQMGAFDCFAKGASYSGLAEIVVEASKSKPIKPEVLKTEACIKEWKSHFDIIAIGSSTGGVEAIEEVLKRFPANSPPIVICQHIPALYTKSLAERLNKVIPHLSIQEGKDDEVLTEGMVRIAPGGSQHLIVKRHARLVKTHLFSHEPVGGHRPSVDVLFKSVAQSIKKDALAIILTGMGKDGASGLLDIRRAGGRTIGQDEQSSVVYGMPRVAAKIGAVEHVSSLTRIPNLAMSLKAQLQHP